LPYEEAEKFELLFGD